MRLSKRMSWLSVKKKAYHSRLFTMLIFVMSTFYQKLVSDTYFLAFFSGDNSVFKSDGEWNMTGLSAKEKLEYYPDAPDIPYSHVLFTIYFKRRSMYYVFNLVMPCVLISGITVLGFVLPSDSGEKVSLGITVLLSLTVFLLLIAESMPPSNDVPVIGKTCGFWLHITNRISLWKRLLFQSTTFCMVRGKVAHCAI